MPVAQHGCLGGPRGPAGEQQGRRLLRVHGPGGLGRPVAAAGKGEEIVPHLCLDPAPVGPPAYAVGIAHQVRRLHALDQRVDFRIGEPVVDGHVRDARPCAGKEPNGDREVRDVEHDETFGVRGAQGSRRRSRGVVEFLIGDRIPGFGIDESHAFAEPRRCHFQQHHDVHAEVSFSPSWAVSWRLSASAPHPTPRASLRRP